ncbi:GNAT family N-acetyltransferase [Metabacillus herbersteinensis]|uniref:GNAT family N-acetyltransferase n=1 Tax=Metabacillus herbersteinensis TaxID=283816 RepID=A0ABV6GBL7_9BACI
MQISELKFGELDTYLKLLQELDKDNVLSIEEAQLMHNKVSNYPFYKIYCAANDEVIIGTFSLIICDNFGHGGLKFAIVENVVVHPEYKDMGIGKKMLKEAMNLAINNKCYKLMLSSNENRQEAHAFYDSLDFKRHGVSFMTELIT